MNAETSITAAGGVAPLSPSAAKIEKRFWAKVRKSEGCWEWTAARHSYGYGVFNAPGRRSYGAHRFSWELRHGPILDGLWVLHRCDNPPCVRPDHLFLGTPKDNTADMCAKGRGPRGSRQWYAKVGEDDVREIRRLCSSGMKQRDVAARFAITQAAVWFIVNRRTWAHVY